MKVDPLRKHTILMRYVGSVQVKVLDYILEHDEDRHGVTYNEIYRSMNIGYPHKFHYNDIWHGVYNNKGVVWHDAWRSMKMLYKRKILCKIIPGEEIIETKEKFNYIMRNKAWFEFSSGTNVEPRFTISPDLDFDILREIVKTIGRRKNGDKI